MSPPADYVPPVQTAAGRRPRVLQVVDSLGPGGAEKLVVMVAGMLRGEGVEVTVLSLSLRRGPGHSVEPELLEAGARVTYLAPTTRHGLVDVRRFVRVAAFVRRGRFDLVQTHLLHGNTIGCGAARLCGIPAIATVHDTGGSHDGHRPKEWVEGLVVRRAASSVVAVGEVVAAAYEAGSRPGPMVVIPNPVSGAAELTDDQKRALREEICGDAQRPLLVSAGRLSNQKGHDELIRAFALVVRRCPEAVLAVAGTGELHDDLSRLISELGLEGSVFLLGWRDDILRLLAAADLYVSPSRWEGMPMVVLEAMAAGTPVVATAVGDLPTLLGEGRGVLVPLGDRAELASAVAEVLADPALATRLAADARRYVADHHDAGRWGKRLLALYATVQPAASWAQGRAPSSAR